MKISNKPVLLAMASLLVIVGLIVGVSWHVLSRKDTMDQASRQNSTQTANNKDSDKEATASNNPASESAKPTGETPAPTPQNKPAPDSQSQSAKTNAIVINGDGFSPANLTVKKGATVTWTNKDSAAHAIASDGASSLHSPQLQAGQSYTYTFANTGSFAYSDAMNPSATGTITVTD